MVTIILLALLVAGVALYQLSRPVLASGSGEEFDWTIRATTRVTTGPAQICIVVTRDPVEVHGESAACGLEASSSIEDAVMVRVDTGEDVEHFVAGWVDTGVVAIEVTGNDGRREARMVARPPLGRFFVIALDGVGDDPQLRAIDGQGEVRTIQRVAELPAIG